MLRQLALPWYFEFARLSPQTILPNDEVLLLYLQSFRYSKSLKHLSDKPKCARKPAQKSIVIDRMSLHGMVEQWQWRSCSSKPAVCHFITSRRLVNSISTMRETRYLDRKVWVKSFIQRCIDSCERTRILFLQKAQVWRETIFFDFFLVWCGPYWPKSDERIPPRQMPKRVNFLINLWHSFNAFQLKNNRSVLKLLFTNQT